MTDVEWLPADLYLANEEVPPVGGARPVCQGDVFIGLPIVRGANEVKPTQWRARASWKENALSMLVAHPCSSRSHSTHRLKDNISLAPVVPKPDGFDPPWTGYFELFPLPALHEGQDYVANLSEVFPVRAEYLVGRRVACLKMEGLAALLDRLAKNATRLEAQHVPGHFASEAERLFFEFELWGEWAEAKRTEEGFQEWLDGPWAETSTRRRSLRLHFEEIQAELRQEL